MIIYIDSKEDIFLVYICDGNSIVKTYEVEKVYHEFSNVFTGQRVVSLHVVKEGQENIGYFTSDEKLIKADKLYFSMK